MSNTEENILRIPDPLCAQVGLKASWGFGNNISVYAGRGKPSEKPSGESVGQVLVHQIKRDTDLHTPTCRKLVNETQGIFLRLQHLDNAPSSSEERKVERVKISREYRSVIKALVMELQQLLDSCFEEQEKEKVMNQLEVWELIELIWNLCEVLYVDTAPGGVVLSQLLDWLRMHFVEGDQIAREAMQHDTPDCHPHYWHAVYIFVLHGRIEEARQLLMQHEQGQSAPYTIVSHLLAKMPLYTSFVGQSLSEFDVRWRHWQDECVQRLEQAQFASHPELNTICRILAGEDQVFIELSSYLGEWYCMLISRLLYQHPTVKSCDLQYHSQFCIDAYGGHSQLQLYDQMMLAALEYDLLQLIRVASENLSNWWFAAHLTDLLHHCGKLVTQSFQYGESLREYLLLEYAGSLVSHCSLWQVGFTYLDHCPHQGRYFLEQNVESLLLETERKAKKVSRITDLFPFKADDSFTWYFLEHYVESLPLETEWKAEKVLRICEQREMTDQVRSICKVLGMRALRHQRLGTALSWGLRSKDVTFATFLAERFLDEYAESGDFSNEDLLDNLGASMLLSSKLTFLGKYREFHRLYEESEFKAAASLLLSLLTARIAPKKFWLTLLTDALPLLEAKEVVLDEQQTYELLHCVEELSAHRRLQGDTQGQESGNGSMQSTEKQTRKEEIEADKLQLLRLALARNLARTIVHEGGQAINA